MGALFTTPKKPQQLAKFSTFANVAWTDMYQANDFSYLTFFLEDEIIEVEKSGEFEEPYHQFLHALFYHGSKHCRYGLYKIDENRYKVF